MGKCSGRRIPGRFLILALRICRRREVLMQPDSQLGLKVSADGEAVSRRTDVGLFV